MLIYCSRNIIIIIIIIIIINAENGCAASYVCTPYNFKDSSMHRKFKINYVKYLYIYILTMYIS